MLRVPVHVERAEPLNRRVHVIHAVAPVPVGRRGGGVDDKVPLAVIG
jgi:hypothetical protein